MTHRADMEFLSERSTGYLTSERSERVRYRVNHQKRNFIFQATVCVFCLFYKHLTNKKKLTLFTFQKNKKKHKNALLFPTLVKLLYFSRLEIAQKHSSL